MSQRFNAWKAGGRLGARAAFVAGIFLVMSFGAVLADAHGTFGGAFRVPGIQASHGDSHAWQARSRSGESDQGQSGSQGQAGSDVNGTGEKDDCGNGDDQFGYQDQCVRGHSSESHGHGHGHGHGRHHED